MFSFSEKNGAGVSGGVGGRGEGRLDRFAPAFSAAPAAAAVIDRTVPPWEAFPWDEDEETAPESAAETQNSSSLLMARNMENRAASSEQKKSTSDGSIGADSNSSSVGADTVTEIEEEEESNGQREQEERPVTNINAKEAAKAAFLKILHRAKEGDRNAFEEIYQLYHRRIYNAVYGMLSDADDAQDVTQDVFIRLHDALPTLRADEAFSTYLYRIALNLCRDRARRKKRVRFQSIDTPRAGDEGSVEPMDFPDAGKLPEETLSTDELQTRVREAVQTLSEDHKAVIVMHHFQGMEVNTIAEILGVPSGTVKSRLARGRDQLHRKLRSYLNVQE